MRPVGKQRLEHVCDAGTLLEWLEEDGAHREWLSAAAALRRRRVAGGRSEEGSRPALKWMSRFVELRWSLWLCRPGQRVDGEGRHQRCGRREGRRRRWAVPGQLWVVTSTRRRQHGEEPRGRPNNLGTPTTWVIGHSGVAVWRVGGGHGKRSEAHGRVEVVERERWRGRVVRETFSCCEHARDKAGYPTWDGGDRWCTVTVVSPCVVSRPRLSG
jgi:hypothetical protein